MMDEEEDQASKSLSESLLRSNYELWRGVEEGANASASPDHTDPHIITVQELLSRPRVISTIQAHGIQKLADISLPDDLVLGRIGDDSIITMGSQHPSFGNDSIESVWRQYLAPSPPSSHPPKKQQAAWHADIPIKTYLVTIKNAANPDCQGLLQPLLRRWQAGGCSFTVFSLPAVHAVIDWKWETYCKKLLQIELLFFLLWMAAFYSFTAAFQDEDVSLSLAQLLASPRGQLTVACDVLALLGMAPFVAIEAATVHAYGVWGWATAWNVLDLSCYTLQLFIISVHLGRFSSLGSGWLSIAAALLCLLLLFRLQYFSRVLSSNIAFFDDLKEVVVSVKTYLLFLAMIVLGYAASFQILFRADQKQHPEFLNLPRSFIQMVTWSAGNADLNPLYQHASNPVAACVFGVSFVFILGIVLLNLLIGMITTSLDRLREDEMERQLLSKAQAIDELDAVLPQWVERRYPHLFPPFIHVLKVDKAKMDGVCGSGGGGGGQRQDDDGTQVLLSSLKEEIKQVQEQLQVLMHRLDCGTIATK